MARIQCGRNQYHGVCIVIVHFQLVIMLTSGSTVGAGDTFIAGTLYGLTCHEADWDFKRKLEFANELAGLKVLQEGFNGLGNLMRYRISSTPSNAGAEEDESYTETLRGTP